MTENVHLRLVNTGDMPYPVNGGKIGSPPTDETPMTVIAESIATSLEAAHEAGDIHAEADAATALALAAFFSREK